MSSIDGGILAYGSSDSEDRLLYADTLLEQLQLDCGGSIPGDIAIPELREYVGKVRRTGLAFSGMVQAQDAQNVITAWVFIQPDRSQGGTTIHVRSWDMRPILGQLTDEHISKMVDRHLAELHAYLDAEQRILFVFSASQELEGLGALIRAGAGQVWSDVCPPIKDIPQAAEWYQVDGAIVEVSGSSRVWRVRLIPLKGGAGVCIGFEFLLVSDQVSAMDGVIEGGCYTPIGSSFIGQDLSPILSQPIARIISNADIISTRLAGPLADAYAEYAEEISSAGSLLLGLLDDVADLEVVDSESFSISQEAIDLAEVAYQAVGILSGRAQERGMSIAFSSGNALPAFGEFRRALQIVLNLIGNAIRYAPKQTQIIVDFVHLDASVRVVVVDQGPGLSSEDQGRVFDKFERLGRSGDGGSGLGLYISRKLAWAMRGNLYVESRIGYGARFVLELPSDPTI